MCIITMRLGMTIGARQPETFIMDRPAFANESPAMSKWQRRIIGIACATVALVIFAIILHFLQSFKKHSLRMQEEKRASLLPPKPVR